MAEKEATVGLSDLSHSCFRALLSEPPRHPATDILKRPIGSTLTLPIRTVDASYGLPVSYHSR